MKHLISTLLTFLLFGSLMAQPLTPNQLQKYDHYKALADETLEMIHTFMDNQ